MKQHIENLKKLFPNAALIACSSEWNGNKGGIWTSFGEEGIANYWRCGWENELSPKLQEYLDNNNLYGEWNDPGTFFIYPS